MMMLEIVKKLVSPSKASPPGILCTSSQQFSDDFNIPSVALAGKNSIMVQRAIA